jgi:hypothetical protein
MVLFRKNPVVRFAVAMTMYRDVVYGKKPKQQNNSPFR